MILSFLSYNQRHIGVDTLFPACVIRSRAAEPYRDIAQMPVGRYRWRHATCYIASGVPFNHTSTWRSSMFISELFVYFNIRLRQIYQLFTQLSVYKKLNLIAGMADCRTMTGTIKDLSCFENGVHSSGWAWSFRSVLLGCIYSTAVHRLQSRTKAKIGEAVGRGCRWVSRT